MSAGCAVEGCDRPTRGVACLTHARLLPADVVAKIGDARIEHGPGSVEEHDAMAAAVLWLRHNVRPVSP